MLGLGRNGLRKLAGRRALSAAVAQTTTSTTTPPPLSGDGRKPQFKSNKPFVTSTPIEQIRLQKKYQENLEKNKIETLHDAIEYIEWRGTVFPHTMTKIVGLLENAKDLSSFSDRQLAVLLSVFGARCDTLSRNARAQTLERVEAILQSKGVVLGLLARNQLVESKIDNRSSLNAVEEIQKFEDAEVELDTKSYALLCEIYAKQANTKAITDIIAHMKSDGIPLTEDHAAQLVYSVARGGNYSQIGRVVDTFAASMNVVRLRCAAARAIAEREKDQPGKGLFEVTEMLRAIPTTAKLHSFENGIYALNVLMDMIENGHLEAFKLLSSYLIVSETGTTLSDNRLNLAVIARAKSLLSEGSIEEAISLYSCCHPNFSNDFFLQNLQRKLEDQLKTLTSENFPAYLKTLTLAENRSLVPSASEFLLTACSKSTLTAFPSIFEHVMNNGDLRSVLNQQPDLKKPIARQLAHGLIKSSSVEEKATLLSQIAIVLFAPSTTETAADTRGLYQIVYKLANKDVKLVLPALDKLSGPNVWHEKREFSTAIVHQLLYSARDDHLAIEKLRTLLESNKIGQLTSHRLHQWLTQLLTSDKKEANNGERVNIVAKCLALDFPPDASLRNQLRFGGRNLAKFLSNEIITVSVAKRIVGILEDESRVSLNPEELADAKKVLSASNEKVALIGKLRKSATMARWKASPVTELLAELANFGDKTKESVRLTLKKVTLTNTIKTHKNESIDFLVSVLEQATEWRKDEKEEATDVHLKDLCKSLEAVTLSQAVSTNDMILADRIWQMRSGHLSADVLLSYASRLFLNGQTERADEVCEELRSSSQTIRPVTLEKMGRRLKGVEASKMGELEAYLRKSFNLSQTVTRRVVVQAKTEQLHQLIESNNISGALRMAAEETNESGRAFGQIPLMIEAIRRNDRATLESVHTMVRSAHSVDSANVNLTYALIHENHIKRARDLVERQNLNVDDRVFQYFTTLASTSENPKLLKNLFIVFNGRASTLELNKLLEVTTKRLWSINDMESLLELSREIESTSFPLQNKLRTFFDDIKSKNSSTEDVDFD